MTATDKLLQVGTHHSENVPLIDECLAGETLQAATLDRYRGHLVEFSAWLEGRRLVDATRRDVKKYIHTYLASEDRGVVRQDELHVLGASARKSQLAAIRKLYLYLLDMEEIASDPSHRINIPKVKHVPGLVITDEEVQAFLGAGGHPRCRMQAYLLVHTGAREAEIRSLKWSDVHMDERYIRFNTTKGGKRREVGMSPDLYRALRVYRCWQEKERLRNERMHAALSSAEKSYVLLSPRGDRLGCKVIWKQVKQRAARAGVRVREAPDKCGQNTSELHPHALRRTFATRLRRMGIGIEDIADILGHESPETTKRHYAFAPKERHHEIMLNFRVGDE